VRTGASLVLDLDVTLRSAFAKWGAGQLDDQLSSKSRSREMRKQCVRLKHRDAVLESSAAPTGEDKPDSGKSVDGRSNLPFFVQLP
jgi:hypothetical protein